MTPDDSQNAPKLGPNEYWIEPQNVDRWLDDGCFSVVSPLDAESVAEIELSEDHERWLEWLKKFQITKVPIVRPELQALLACDSSWPWPATVRSVSKTACPGNSVRT